MNKYNTNQMYGSIMPYFNKNREDLDDLNITHIIPFRSESEVLKPLIELYGLRMESLCKELKIKYEPCFIVPTDENDTMYDSIKDEIIKSNNDDSVNGILFDYPFRCGGYGQLFNSYITKSKDIGYVSSLESRPIKNPGYHNMPPHVYIMKHLLRFYGIGEDCLSLSVIANSYNSHKGLIPENNFNFGKYTFISNKLRYTETFNHDIIVSFMTNTTFIPEYTKTVYHYKFNPKLVLDFGYHTNGNLYSINKDFFSIDTQIYTWDTGLMDLYLYGIINNLLY